MPVLGQKKLRFSPVSLFDWIVLIWFWFRRISSPCQKFLWSLKLMTPQAVQGAWIRASSYGWFRVEWLLNVSTFLRTVNKEKTNGDRGMSSIENNISVYCSSFKRKQREMQLIFTLSNIRPKGLNINFSFIWIGTLNKSCARLSQSRSHGFLVWCGRTRHFRSLVRTSRSYDRASRSLSRYALKSSTVEQV